jgi:hypothetical protein
LGLRLAPAAGTLFDPHFYVLQRTGHNQYAHPVDKTCVAYFHHVKGRRKNMAKLESSFASAAKAKLGAEVVTQTLDKLNNGPFRSKKSKGGSAMSATYNFSKDVLSAAYSDKGSIANIKG